MKRLSALLVLLMLVVSFAQAQSRQVTGTVTSSDDGSPLIGVSIQVKGTTTGGTTDLDGKYSLNVPANATLVFSFVGFKPQEVQVGERSIVNVILESESQKMEQVVVTAIGIKRSEKSLGYAATSVNSDELSKARDASLMGSLQGKVAGVTISSGGGTPGASTKVILRGYSSITGNNSPLYIVDGSPINNSQADANGADFGNGANVVNPDDVASVTILKGASATALYGSRAANGVIMITTKSGKSNKGKKITVEYSGNATFSTLLKLPQMQNEFGQGWGGVFQFQENGSWGPKFDGKIRPWGAIYNHSQQIKPFVAEPNNIKDFYDVGTSYTHSIGLSGGNEDSNFYMAISNTSTDGIIPGNVDTYVRNNVSIKGSTKANKMTISGSANYAKTQGKILSDGYGGTSASANLYSEILQIPRDMSIVDFKDLNNPFNQENWYFTNYAYNPYYAISANGNKRNEDRLFGNVTMEYQFLPELKGTIRIGTDVANSQEKSWEAVLNYDPNSWALNNPEGTKKAVNPGYYSEDFLFRRELNIDYLLNYQKDITPSININVLGGYNINQRNAKELYSYVSSLDIPGFYNIVNSADPAKTTTGETMRRIYGVFGQVDFAYKNWWFVTATARSDYSSTLPRNNNSFFYPGINTAIVLSDAIPAIKPYIPFAKVRLSWGRTGNDAEPYRVNSTFGQASIYNPFGRINMPLKGINGYLLGTTIGNPNLKPEISTEKEIGLDFRFLNNRIGVDFTYYDKSTTDQILPVPMANTTGYLAQVKNFGEVQNKGIELMLNLVPIKTTNFEWNANVSYSRNRNLVISLAPGLDQVLLRSIYSIDFVAVVGQPLGVFKGYVNELDPQGHIVVDQNGYPRASTTKGILGNAESKYTMGISNTFRYKDFTLGFTFDIREGGLMYSGTADLQYFVGNAPQTTYNDRQPWLVPNSVYGVQAGDGTWTYSENNHPINYSNVTDYYYATNNKMADDMRLIPRSYVKLREANLTYTVPKKYLGKLPLGNLQVSVYGKNLLVWTPVGNNFVDPEVTSFGNDLTGDLGEFRTNPTLRSFGFSVKATF